ncbi:copper-binding protein [uncultured Castellaniella sp.]|uniref:copper-binding protein n=1 Tax=uncultured Castellaniella sp. TaxID=647907 RepID=UPI00262A8CDF|nr:copper-binding protein [uncultured Castellaniella sp.]
MRFPALRTLNLLAALRGAGPGILLSAAVAAPAALVWPAPAVAQAQPVQAQASGQVVRVDAAAGKIAIRHGAISKLDIPAMTLVYHLDPALLRGIAAGDSVNFTATRVQGQYRILALEKK